MLIKICKILTEIENYIKELVMSKAILDVCCGGRMFYKDKQDERVLFCDIDFFIHFFSLI